MIDKSIRQHYNNKHSAKNRRRYFTGAFGGAGAGRGADPSPGGGGGGGGWNPGIAAQERAAVEAAAANQAAANQAAAQKAEVDRQQRVADQAAAERQRVIKENEAREAVRERAIQEAAQPVAPIFEAPIRKDILPTFMEPPKVEAPIHHPEDTIEDIMHQEILDEIREEEGEMAVREAEGKVDVGFQEALRKQAVAEDLRQKQQDPDYGQFFRQPPVIEPSRSGLETALNIASWTMPFLKVPKEIATGVKMAKTFSDIKNRKGIYGTALGLGEKLTGRELNLSNLTSTIDKGTRLRSRPKGMP